MYGEDMTHSVGHVAAKTNRRPGCGPTAEWVSPTMTENCIRQRPDAGRIVTTTDPRDGRAKTYATERLDTEWIAYDRDLLEEIER